MRKKGGSELIAEILLIIIVIMLITFVLYFFLGYLKEKEAHITIQNDLNSERLDIDDVSFDSVDDQKLTLVLGKGAGGEELFNRTNQTVSRMNITVSRLINQTNITYTNVTVVTFFNETNVTHTNVTYITNSTLVNNSNADIVTVNDVSTSMDNEDKIGQLKTALKNFIDSALNNTDNRIGLVAYSTTVVDAYCSGGLSNNSIALKNLVSSWNTVESTCICCGLDRGIQYLSAVPVSANRTKIVILMSDGGANKVCNAYVSPELSGVPPCAPSGGCPWWGSGNDYCNFNPNDACDDAIYTTQRAFKNQGIITYTIGFGSNSSMIDNVTLINISKVGNGTYYYANLTGLADAFNKIQWEINTTTEVNITWNETVLVNWTEQVNVTWNETIITTWIEQKNETINETIEIEIYTPIVSYDYLKIVFYAGGKSFSKKENVSSIPGPHETREVNITLDPSWSITTNDLTKIEIYAVAITEGGEEVISQEPIAVWEKESMYTRK